MEIQKYLEERKHILSFLVHLLNHSFPLLAYVSFRHKLDRELYTYPARLIYDKVHNKELRLYAKLVCLRIEERISPQMLLTIAGLLKFCCDCGIDEKVKDSAMQELLGIYNSIADSDQVIGIFKGSKKRLYVNRAGTIRRDINCYGYCTESREGMHYKDFIGVDAPNEYKVFLSEIRSIQTKARWLAGTLNHIPKLYITELESKYRSDKLNTCMEW